MNFRKGLCILAGVGLALAVGSVAVAADNPKPRPFWGSSAGVVHWDLMEGCPTQGGYYTVTETVGEWSHLGRTTFKEVHCAGADGFPLDGDAVFTAANGDQVFGTYVVGSAQVVLFDPPIFVQAGQYTITGGTGRFATATGSIHALVTLTMAGDPTEPGIRLPIQFVASGVIRY